MHKNPLELRDVIDRALLRSVYQPIVDLGTGVPVAVESLARGPEGPWASPAALFPEARRLGLLRDLDRACFAAAVAGVARGAQGPVTLFVNLEPEVVDDDHRHLETMARELPADVQLVVEVTERALATRPAELLRTVDRVRELGWRVALDDVGAEDLSLAFMPLLRPDVVKLDLSLVQRRPTPAVAQVMNAVNAYAERTGAVLLAEGIENEAHLLAAQALGATLGQGWHFGRPADTVPPLAAHAQLGRGTGADQARRTSTPFEALPAHALLRRSPKRLLIELSKQLEREAVRVGPTAVVAATFQEARHFTAATAERYRAVVEEAGFVAAFGRGLDVAVVPGLRGGDLGEDDAVLGEWDVVVLGPHFSAALLARDRGDRGVDDLDRTFDYALTYDRDVVAEAARALLDRVALDDHAIPSAVPAWLPWAG